MKGGATLLMQSCNTKKQIPTEANVPTPYCLQDFATMIAVPQYAHRENGGPGQSASGRRHRVLARELPLTLTLRSVIRPFPSEYTQPCTESSWPRPHASSTKTSDA